MIQRENIGIFGKTNSGKSSLMNLLTQQETSIVDSTPGTTADTKITVMELHSFGPVRIFDTAGIDETGELGEKKRKKVFKNLKEANMVLLVINPETNNFQSEKEILELAREQDKQIFVIFNLFNPQTAQLKIAELIEEIPLLKFYPQISLETVKTEYRQKLIEFILKYYQKENFEVSLFPEIKEDKFYLLNIPMDEETPQNRFLRPQSMAVEYITRHKGIPVCFRMDLGKARNKGSEDEKQEKERYLKLLSTLGEDLELIVTDSQAMDIVSPWTPEPIKLTTFSIMMIQYVSKGRLQEFVKGIETMEKLQKGDKVLIVEACNHSRIAEDIGTIQIPNFLKKHYPGVEVEFNFGREFQDNTDLQKYSLMIHCGGCMITAQKLAARIRDLDTLGVPYTNYGIFLSYLQGKSALDKVVSPWIK